MPSSAFYNCDFIEKITLCFKTEKIGDYAFYNCAKLVDVELGTSLITIGDGAFKDCIALESITLPVTATNWGSSIFSGCTALSRLNSSEEGTVVLPSGLTIIPVGTFYNCSLIKNVVVGDITEIKYDAFYGCKNIVRFNSDTDGKLVIPVGVTDIGSEAFKNLSLITVVVVPDTVKNIGSGAFKGCDSITDITLPFVGSSRSSNYVEMAVFGYIFGYTTSGSYSDITVYQGVGNYYFYIPKTIRNVTITSQTEIPSCAFYNCDFIEMVTIKSELTSINDCAFYNCKSLIGIEIPNNVNKIGNYAFYNCTNLVSIIISDSVSSVGYYAFYGCKDLTILCEFEEQPGAWDSSWNVSSFLVVWGYVAEEQTYNFVTNGADSIESINSFGCIVLPTPVREGWYFVGWYDNAEFSGTPIKFSYYSATTHTLYAKWLTEEEWLALNDGTSFAKAYEITRSQPATVVIDTIGEDVYYKFTATIDGTYVFTASGEMDTHCTLYNESYVKIGYGDDNGNNRNFSMTVTMSAGETVYLKVGSPVISAIGTFVVTVV